MEDYLRMGKADEVILRTIKTDLTSQLGKFRARARVRHKIAV